MSKTSSRRLVIALSLSAVWIAVLITAGLQRQAILDWWALRDYTAPTAVAQLASDDTMTESTRRIFYVNKPRLQQKASFTQCNTNSEQAAVLGCYHSDQRGIYILDVTDSRLAGVEQVTAAHETLHAAYDRLSSSERQRIDALLLNFYQNGLQDQEIKDQIDGYRKSEPDALVNEMHSIFATEVPNLPAALETYYQRYFTDRAKIVNYYEQYHAEFTNREDQIAAADSRLKAQKQQIDELESEVSAQETTVVSRQRQLQQYRQSNQISAYNSGVDGFNTLVESYNTSVENLRALIASYNQLVQTRNQLAAETEQLANEITTNATPVGEQ